MCSPGRYLGGCEQKAEVACLPASSPCIRIRPAPARAPVGTASQALQASPAAGGLGEFEPRVLLVAGGGDGGSSLKGQMLPPGPAHWHNHDIYRVSQLPPEPGGRDQQPLFRNVGEGTEE